MAQVTGMSAARMIAAEQASIVSGTVVGDNLMLTTKGGTVTNAGNVRGPALAVSIPEKAPTALPDTYPVGITVFNFASTAGWPTTFAVVTTVIENISRGYQIITQKTTGAFWIRSVMDNAWGVWMKMVQQDNTSGIVSLDKLRITGVLDASETSTTHPFQIGPDTGLNLIIDGNEIIARNNGTAVPLYVEGGVTTNVAPVAAGDLTRKNYVDGLVTGIGIPTAADLNTYTLAGVYTQSSSAQAAAGTNYPSVQAGVLEVRANALTSPGMIWQTYTNFGSTGNGLSWRRTYYNGTWYPWVINDTSDTGWVTLAISNTTNFQLYGTQPLSIRRIGKTVAFKGALYVKVAGIVESATQTTANQMCVIPAAYLPATSDYDETFNFVCQGSSTNRWTLRVTAGSAYAGRYGPSASGVSTWLPFYVTWLID